MVWDLTALVRRVSLRLTFSWCQPYRHRGKKASSEFWGIDRLRIASTTTWKIKQLARVAFRMPRRTNATPPSPNARDDSAARFAAVERSVRVQCAIAACTVAVWMALGWGLQLSGDAYLVAGVPIIMIYQLGIQRRPLRALWRFDGAPLRWGRGGLLVGICAAALPAWQLVSVVDTPGGFRDLVLAAWLACAIVGAFGVAWSIANWRELMPSNRVFEMMALAVCGAVAFTIVGLLQRRHFSADPLSFVLDFVLYTDVSFVLEEVAFRGAFDVAIAGTADGPRRRSNVSAGFVGTLWGLWHLPMYVHGLADIPTALRLVAFHTAIGLTFSQIARLAGNLAPTVLAHAFIDSWRNLWIAA